MNVVLPPNAQDEIRARLKTGLEESNSRYRGVHNILMAAPQLATDPETRRLLERTLLDPAIGFRWEAAKIFAMLGDPLGTLHLTYNSLHRHPVLGQDNTAFSGWHEVVLRWGHRIDSQNIALLVEEMRSPARGFHGVTLAIAGEKMDPRDLHSHHAAFQSAWDGEVDAIDLLIEWLEQTPGRDAVAIWAILRNLRSEDGGRRIRQLRAPQNRLYDDQRDPIAAPFLRFKLWPLLDFAQTVIESAHRHPLAYALLRYHLTDFDGTPAGSPASAYEALRQGHLGRCFIAAASTPAMSAFPTALLTVLGDLFPEDVEVLAQLQEAAIKQYIAERRPIEAQPGLRPAFLPIWAVPPRGVDGQEVHFYNLKGFEVQVEAKDLLQHGVAWLRSPLPYVSGLH